MTILQPLPRQGDGEMQRLSLALLLVIAMIAGFTARAIITPSGFPAATVSGNADTTTANLFYDALNDALAGGPLDPLASLLAGVFRDHDPDTGATRTAGEFLDDLRAMGASPQGIRLAPISIEASGESLVVGIVPEAGEPLRVAGIDVTAAPLGPHFETLRVVGGKVVDRWAPTIPWLEVVDPGGPAIPVPALTEVSATLMRVTVAGGMTYAWSAASAGILAVESGAGHWSVASNGMGMEPARLQPGEFVSFEAGEQVELRSATNDPVTALLFVTALVPKVDLSNISVTRTEVAQGISHSVLWSGAFSERDEITRYRPARLVVPAHASLELRHDQGIDTLLALDHGLLDLWAPDGTITLLGADRWPEEHTGSAQLDADHPGAVVAPATVTVQNQSDRPIALFVLAIERTTVAS